MNSSLHLPTEELRQQYIRRRGEELGTYIQALKSQDFDVIAIIGHRMRGNGISFGFPELSILGEKMEKSAHEKDTTSLRMQLVEFMNWLEGQKTSGHES